MAFFPGGTCDERMKVMVSVPGMSRMPWASRPNSLAAACSQTCFNLGWRISCQYSNVLPESGSNTAHAHCCIIGSGNGVFGLVVPTEASMAVTSYMVALGTSAV